MAMLLRIDVPVSFSLKGFSPNTSKTEEMKSPLQMRARYGTGDFLNPNKRSCSISIGPIPCGAEFLIVIRCIWLSFLRKQKSARAGHFHLQKPVSGRLIPVLSAVRPLRSGSAVRRQHIQGRICHFPHRNSARTPHRPFPRSHWSA